MPKCVCEGSLDIITFRPYSTEWAGEPTERESANAQLLPVVNVQHVSIIAVAPLDDPNHTPFP